MSDKPTTPSTTRAGDAVYAEADWYEDLGPVLWHHLDEWGGLCEAPIVAYGGEDLDDKQPWDGYYSHWSPLPELPQFPVRAAMIAPPGRLICDVENADVS
jgi:hypothetical protein